MSAPVCPECGHGKPRDWFEIVAFWFQFMVALMTVIGMGLIVYGVWRPI